MIFLTVGSMFPFDRLVRAVDELVGNRVITEGVTAQIGDGSYEPRHMAFDRFLPKPEYDLKVGEASALIGHAGAGTIALALGLGKPLLAIPRMKRYGESVNDHQIVTARKFGSMGHILVAEEIEQVGELSKRLASFVPRPREIHPEALAARIGAFLRTFPL